MHTHMYHGTPPHTYIMAGVFPGTMYVLFVTISPILNIHEYSLLPISEIITTTPGKDVTRWCVGWLIMDKNNNNKQLQQGNQSEVVH